MTVAERENWGIRYMYKKYPVEGLLNEVDGR